MDEQGQTAASNYQKDVDFASLIDRIRGVDETAAAAAATELYQVFNRGMRYFICRQLGGGPETQNAEDILQDAFLVVLEAIREGKVREPGALPGYLHTVIVRKIYLCIEDAIKSRNLRSLNDYCEAAGPTPNISIYDLVPNPEKQLLEKENRELMLRALADLTKREREVLTLFYLQEQKPEQIQLEMKLTETSFRLLKSRSKTKFGTRARNLLMAKELSMANAKMKAKWESGVPTV